MSNGWTFESALQQFQHELVTTWHDQFRTGQRIAISIQLRDETQDRTRACSTPTRSLSGAPKAVNEYCQRILDEQWKETGATLKCDQLDFYLKERYESRNGQKSPSLHPCRLSCRCHGGVSNILIPFRYDGGDVWHIFFGQFLLKSENHDIQNILMLERSIEPVRSLSPTEKAYLQENVFVDEALHKSHFNNDISLVSLPDFLAFKTYTLHKLNKFLGEVYSDPAKRRSLEHYKKRVNVTNLLALCSALKNDVQRHPSLPSAEKQKLLLKIAHIGRDVGTNGADEETVARYTEWVRLGHTGNITNQAWRNQTLTANNL